MRTHQDEKTSNTSHHYHKNILPFVDDIVALIEKIISLSKEQLIRPVIMIDGLAGTGKSTFSRDLVARCKEKKLNICYFEQDAFGIDRWKRHIAQISSCAEIARDPKTVVKLIELMTTGTTKIPDYNGNTGTRVLDKKTLNAGDIIIYEGVSSLSGVIYENTLFNPTIAQQFNQTANQEVVDYTNYIPIRIFFNPDSDETVYQSRMKRDMHEKGVKQEDFATNWLIFRRNNWLYTQRGIQNANIIVTRKGSDFEFHWLNDIVYHNQIIKYKPDTSINMKSTHHLYASMRTMMLEENKKSWFGDHYLSLFHAHDFDKSVMRNTASNNDQDYQQNNSHHPLKRPDEERKKQLKIRDIFKDRYHRDLAKNDNHYFTDDNVRNFGNATLHRLFTIKTRDDGDIELFKKYQTITKDLIFPTNFSKLKK